jgi:hypothetical protein
MRRKNLEKPGFHHGTNETDKKFEILNRVTNETPISYTRALPKCCPLLTLADVTSRLEALRVFDDDTDVALEQLLRRNLAAVHIARNYCG